MIDFTNIDYLKEGNAKQQKVYSLLVRERLLDVLEKYDPLVVGTIPIGIDIASSDIDIVCCYDDKKLFADQLYDCFSSRRGYAMHIDENRVVASFFIDGFEVEIFGQNTPTREQNAYRHMIIEHYLLEQNGELFRNRLIALKEHGIKTEPAFAELLNLEGDPYEALLLYGYRLDII